jgi:hypothetical protein
MPTATEQELEKLKRKLAEARVVGAPVTAAAAPAAPSAPAAPPAPSVGQPAAASAPTPRPPVFGGTMAPGLKPGESPGYIDPLQAAPLDPNRARNFATQPVPQVGSSFGPSKAIGGEDPRDASYWADVGKIQHNVTTGLQALGVEEQEAGGARRRALEDLATGENRNVRGLRQRGRASGLLYSTTLNDVWLGEANEDYLRNTFRTDEAYDAAINRLDVQAQALRSGATIDEAVALGEASTRKAGEIASRPPPPPPPEAAPPGAPGPGPAAPAPAPGPQSIFHPDAVVPPHIQAQMFNALTPGERGRWQRWHNQHPTLSFMNWQRKGRP